MCGIAGFVDGFVPDLMARMNRLQAHRGPDGQGVFENAKAGAALGHVRLAILDLTDSAAQPMSTPDGRYVLVYNGEIYNFRELRTELEQDGIHFRSTGDTEVLLRGLERQGEEFLRRLNGIFAFALWDTHERELLLARDPAGVKPLYWTEPEPGTLLFSSEIKALFAHPRTAREPDFMALQQHLTFCHAAGERTAFKGIRRLAPGTVLRWRAATRSHETRRYWRPSFGGVPDLTREEAARQLQRRVREATVRQLVSDVPVGSFLSGGLDSSLVTAVAAGAVGPEFQCYTITYPASENVLDNFVDDAPYARDVAGRLGVKLREIEIKPEVAALLPKLIYHLDEPLADPATIACYLISKLARDNGAKVLLSGQGADELFGGYPRYTAMQATRLVTRLPRLARRAVASGAQLLPGARAGKAGASLRRARRVLRAVAEDPNEQFLAYCASTSPDDVKAVLSAAVQAELSQEHPFGECLDHMRQQQYQGLDAFLERDLAIYLPNHNLLYTDKMGMAVGLEARVPLLDQELLDFVPPLPAEWKVTGSKTKALLREAARGLVPESIIRRPKAGFGAPYRKWLRHDLEDLWNELTDERTVRTRGWFDVAGLRTARERSQTGRADLYMLQWAALTIELWARAFMDRNPANGIAAEDLRCSKSSRTSATAS